MFLSSHKNKRHYQNLYLIKTVQCKTVTIIFSSAGAKQMDRKEYVVLEVLLGHLLHGESNISKGLSARDKRNIHSFRSCEFIIVCHFNLSITLTNY